MSGKPIGFLAAALVATTLYATGVAWRKGHPDTYTVRSGDTLWDISARFLAKPWRWPDIWRANPKVRQPDLIYPGDVLTLSLRGEPHLTRESVGRRKGHTVRLKPRIRIQTHAVPAIPLNHLKLFLENVQVMRARKIRNAPYVVGFEENRLIGTTGHRIYVRRLKSRPGKRWIIIRPTHLFRRFGSKKSEHVVGHPLDSDVAVVHTPWYENKRHETNWGHSTVLGLEVTVIGHAETLHGGDPATLLLLQTEREIRAGDRVLPQVEPDYNPFFYPHPPGSLPSHGHVIGFTRAMHTVGSRQVVILSVGSRQGVNNGTTFAIWRPGRRIFDDVAQDSMQRDTGMKVHLPAEYVGHVMVFRTFDQVSYGMVMHNLRPVKTGDTLQLPG